MIMMGTNITNSADELHKVSEDYFYNSLRNPKPVIDSKIRQLRIVYCLDKKQYVQLKKSLPYIVCGIFMPSFRRKENFAYIERFIIDIDKVSEKCMDVTELRNRIQKDDRVMMCFTSPSEDGIKVMFRLKERCYDYGLYSIFYKDFLRKFSVQYQLDQVIDNTTSDVTRACFISVDGQAFYNPESTPVDLNASVDINNVSELFDLKHDLDKEVDKNVKEIKACANEIHNSDPDNDVIREIRSKLNHKSPQKEEHNVFVPYQLENIMDDMKKYIEQTGIVVSDIKSIQYGKKIQSKLGLKLSEINVFFGKRGFSVVKSPKCGTNEELNNLLSDVINSFLSEYKR